MKKTVLLLTLCCALIACKKKEVAFTYSPDAPRAGQSVSFANQSSFGEDWEWQFGDGVTSTIKSPSHVYKKPGTYRVSLQVDKKKQHMAAKEITVYDTVPTFVCADSVFYIYQDYTFEANLYNPYNYEVTYQWFFLNTSSILPPNAVVTDESMQNSTLHLYFTRPEEAAGIGLFVVLNGDTTEIFKTFNVQDLETNSVYMRTPEFDYQQRIFGYKADTPTPLDERSYMLDLTQDTFQVYNSDTFTLSLLSLVFPDIEGFHIAKRKIYYRADGLWVASIDGANRVQIDGSECYAMTLDAIDSRIYWANEYGVWYMPFIGSDNNKFVTEPSLLNTLNNVTKLAADGEIQ